AVSEALDRPGVRMTYCDGTLELLRTSFAHELRRKSVARLIELYAFLSDLPLFGYGATIFRLEANARGAQPDECYCVGRRMREGELPDVVLEIEDDRSNLDRLAVYRGFDIPEVWLFRDTGFLLYQLVAGNYERIEFSRPLPELDFSLIARLALREDQDEALRELRRVL